MIRFGFIEQVYAKCADDIRHLFQLIRPSVGCDELVDYGKVMDRVAELLEDGGHEDILNKPRVSLTTYLNTFYWETTFASGENRMSVLKYVWERSYRLKKCLAVSLALEKYNFKSFTGEDPRVDDLPSYFAGLLKLLGGCNPYDQLFRNLHQSSIKMNPVLKFYHGNRGFLIMPEN